MKYQNEESDVDNQSDPSGDNLDTSEIMKFLPKKLAKAKYIKGLE